MSILNSFIHGNAVTEILFEGHNPYASHLPDPAVLQALRQKMSGGESLRAFVSGRIVLSGAGVWALTDRALLVHDASRGNVQRLELAQVERLEAQRGRYGHTLRLTAGGQGWSLYGVDREMAHALHQALAARGISSQFDDRPAYSDVWRKPEGHGGAQDLFAQARQRLAA